MAPSKSSAPAIVVTTNAAGDHFAGFEIDGLFVPFASVTANRIEQLRERAGNLATLKDEPGEAAKLRHDEAANALPYTTASTSDDDTSASAKGGSA